MTLFLLDNFRKLARIDWNPVHACRDLLTPFIIWLIGSIVFVGLAKYIENSGYRAASYYNKAIDQAIGPVLWNVIGAVALVAFALCLIFPRWARLADITHHLLMATYLMGAMITGVLLAQYFILLGGIAEYLHDWRTYVYAPIIFLGLVVVLALNLCVGYLAYLTCWSNYFRSTVSEIHISIRVFAGLSVAALAISTLWYVPEV